MNLYPHRFGIAGNLGAAKKASGKGAKGSLFSPGGTPKLLWNKEPSKRKVDISGLFSPEDTLIAIARGMAPGVMSEMEHRATIRGGLTALKMAGIKGYTKVPVNVLKSTIANLPEDDDKLRKYAGKGNDLTAAAKHIRAVVKKHGLEQAAWGSRQLYVLDNIKGFTVGRAVAAAAAPFVFPAWGVLISAGLGVQGAISATIAKQVATDATNNIKNGLQKAKVKAKKQLSTAETTAVVSSRKTPSTSAARTSTSSSSTSTTLVGKDLTKAGPSGFKQGEAFVPKSQRPSPESSTDSSTTSAGGTTGSGGMTQWLVAGGIAALVIGGALAFSGAGSSGAVSATPKNRITLKRSSS
jgi:hypothetical protein